MQKIIIIILVFLFNSCILLDMAKFPVFANPTGSVVKAEILETTNLLTKLGYFQFFSTHPGAGSVSDVFSEASMTDVFVLQLLDLNDKKFYDRDSVDKCKDSISVSTALMPPVLNSMPAADVSNSINDNFLIAYSLIYLCNIQDGKIIYDSGNGGI